MNAINKYASTQNETASKERLMVLLLEAALRHIRGAAAAIEQGQIERSRAPLRKATDIVNELLTTLDRSRAPELVDSLSSLYVFVSGRLMVALGKRDAVAAREAERVLAPIVEGFATAVANLQADGSNGAAK